MSVDPPPPFPGPKAVRQFVQVDHRLAFDPWHPGSILVEGEERQVTLKEWGLFLLLASDAARVWPHVVLYERLWDCAGLVHTSGALRAVVMRLRRALPPGYLASVRGAGYRLLPSADLETVRREHIVAVAPDVVELLAAEALPEEGLAETLHRLLLQAASR